MVEQLVWILQVDRGRYSWGMVLETIQPEPDQVELAEAHLRCAVDLHAGGFLGLGEEERRELEDRVDGARRARVGA